MKLSSWVIIVAAVAIGLMPVAWVWLQYYGPYEQAAQYNRDYKDQLENESSQQARADKRVRDAMALVQKASEQWNVYVASRTPSDALSKGGINLAVNSYQLTVDSLKYRNSAQRALNAQLRKGGIKVVSAPEIPFPTTEAGDIMASYYNYPAFSFPVVLWELGNVTVEGTYNQIMANVRSWANMPHYLAVADGLQITGTSPHLTGSYNVTLVGFLKGATFFTPPAAAPASTGGAGAPAGGRGPQNGPSSVKGRG